MRLLGELETRVMRSMWRRSTATVRQVHADLLRERELAYTTVMTVMERLWRKGILQRTRRGRAFDYTPAVSEAEHAAELMHEVLAATGDRRAALAHFVRGMRKADEAELRRLARRAGTPKR